VSANNMPKPRLPIFIAGAAALLFLASSACFQAHEGESTLVLRLGKPVGAAVKPGLNFKLPYPLESVARLDNRLMNLERPLTQTSLMDAQSLMVGTYALWKIDDPALFLKTVGSIKKAEASLSDILGGATGQVYSQYKLIDIVTIGDSKLPQIEEKIKAIAAPVAKTYGISIETCGVHRQGLSPDKTTESAIERMREARQVLAQEFRLQGEIQAQQILSDARAESLKAINTANSKAEKIRAEGEAKAVASYEVFKKDPKLAEFLFKLEALRLTLTGANTVLVMDDDTSPFDLLKKSSLDSLHAPQGAPVVETARDGKIYWDSESKKFLPLSPEKAHGVAQ
jgi:modulator of FtsH protease HflC